jgi:hypothetical protein
MHPIPQTRWSPTRSQLLGVTEVSPQSTLPRQVSAGVAQAKLAELLSGHTLGLVEWIVLMQSRPAPQSAPVVQVAETQEPTTMLHWQIDPAPQSASFVQP